MPTREEVLALGQEVERQRIARGFRSVRALANMTGISTQHLGQIIRAYQHPKRGYTVPSDEVLEKLAAALDVPLSRLHALLGRFPDQPFPAFAHADSVELAEAFDRLPPYAKKIVQDALRTAQEVVALVEAAPLGGG